MGVEAASVISVIEEVAPAWLVYVSVVDQYEHAEDGKAVRTLTFKLAWSNAERTRTGDELNGATEDLISAVEQRLAERGVKLRRSE